MFVVDCQLCYVTGLKTLALPVFHIFFLSFDKIVLLYPSSEECSVLWNQTMCHTPDFQLQAFSPLAWMFVNLTLLMPVVVLI
jgi:hypothetical protein